jgi:hypothetical protein
MKFSSFYISLFLIVISFQFGCESHAKDISAETSRILATVPVKGNVDQEVYRQFDRLAPELRRISRDNIIKLECRYSGSPSREKDVLNAYQIAAKIEKYLRTQHNLDLDLWITLQLTVKQPKTPILTIALFSDEIKQLDSMPITPKSSD